MNTEIINFQWKVTYVDIGSLSVGSNQKCKLHVRKLKATNNGFVDFLLYCFTILLTIRIGWVSSNLSYFTSLNQKAFGDVFVFTKEFSHLCENFRPEF